jgi:uncharacterized protein
MGGVVSRLILSLSGLTDDSPQSLRRAAAFTDELDVRGVPVSQLLRPRTADGPLRTGSPLVRWLHVRGDAIVLHGYDHAAGSRRVGRRAEFAALPRHEAGLRLVAARRVLTAVGLRTDLFAPPRWLASEGTVEALREQGFGVLADENGVHPLRCGDVVLARVLGFRVAVADEQRAAEAWRCRMFVAEVARTARRGGLVRIHVRSKDLKRTSRRDAVLAAVDAALALGAQPATYRPAGGQRAA